MADLDTEQQQIPDINEPTPAELVEHTDKVLVYAEDLLHQVNAKEAFESFEQGCRS